MSRGQSVVVFMGRIVPRNLESGDVNYGIKACEIWNDFSARRRFCLVARVRLGATEASQRTPWSARMVRPASCRTAPTSATSMPTPNCWPATFRRGAGHDDWLRSMAWRTARPRTVCRSATRCGTAYCPHYVPPLPQRCNLACR